MGMDCMPWLGKRLLLNVIASCKTDSSGSCFIVCSVDCGLDRWVDVQGEPWLHSGGGCWGSGWLCWCLAPGSKMDSGVTAGLV